VRPGRFLLLLFGFLFLGLIGELFDEEKRQLFDLWLIALMMVAAVVFLYRRRTGRPRAAESSPAAERVESVPPRTTRPPIALITLGALLSVSASWIVLVHLGEAPGRHDEAFARLQTVTAVITTLAALLLSAWGPIADPSTLMKLRLAAIGLVGLAAVGIFAVPVIAVGYWFGYVDFAKYVPKIAGAWIYLTMAGVVLCWLRTGSGKVDPGETHKDL
jgi:hypothetical protein